MACIGHSFYFEKKPIIEAKRALPAAGYRNNSSLNNEGSNGNYWSSSTFRSYDAYFLIFNSGGQNCSNINRRFGQSVRAVQSPVKHTITVTASEGGTVTGTGEYIANREATLTAIPNEGYVFACWTDESGKLISSQATCTVTVTKDETYTANFAQPAYVDLGLPSGTLWATFNLGATSPEDAGGYFAWGETETKDYYYYAEGDYKWGTYDGMTKYNETDGLTTLEVGDDAATAQWGNDWRMPTLTEHQELLAECTWTWTDNYNNTGVTGCIVTGKNENAIFLPAAGFRNYEYYQYEGEAGFYWSSELSPDYYPLCAHFVRLTQETQGSEPATRYFGFSVRPVQSTVIHTITVAASEGGTATGGGEYLGGTTATLTAVPDAGYVFAGWSDGSKHNPRTITVTQDSTFTATFVQPEYVDLGLPSGTLWATFNVHAASPEEAGGYFAWGETETKEYYDWSNEGDYKWGTYDWDDDTNYGMTKYNTIDGKTVLDAEDDAATANWGGDWRMPTSAEQTELDTACTWTWTDDYSGTGIRGYIVSSKAEGNTNSIFLPAAGYYYWEYLSGVGKYGCYWSSSRHENFVGSTFYIDAYSSVHSITVSAWYNGYSVRAVQSKKGLPTGVETLSHSVSVEVRKVLEDGMIYILRGDEKYMIDGRKVE